MKLAADAHAKIEAFHRSYSKDGALRLPPVYVYEGNFSRWLTHTFAINAITFGRRVFVNPDLIEKDEGGRFLAPAWLIAHETTHVLQYERAGFVGFLIKYLLDYLRALRELNWKLDKATRMRAYHAIRMEQEALAAENAFRHWKDDVGSATT
ncbi:MAG: hypothetical protein AUG51_24725 [Acidobacteria bacterium 13_1_20CM_3_53_8]|nr:MAG: hypothetical protein AUG51_24725 [Acidobacteria bacterium 13_1_20CM_3_53_8]